MPSSKPAPSSTRPRAGRATLAALAIGLAAACSVARGSTGLATPDLAAPGGARLDSSTPPIGDRFEYALLARGSRASLSLSRPETPEVIGRLEAEVRKTGHELFWFSTGAHGYLVRDPEWVAKAAEIVEPVQALGAEQVRLGAIQGRLAARQGELGRIQGRIAILEARLATPEVPSERETRASMRRELQELAERARDIGVDQRQLDQSQRDLRRRQADLFRRQASASARVMQELRALASDAISSGKARAVPD
jgi:hypothetical protein